MARFWSDVVQDAASLIEGVVREVAPDVVVEIEGAAGADRETVEVRLRKMGREARCVVTFEAWEEASRDPAEMIAAFRTIVRELEAGSPSGAYMFTSKGLTVESGDRDSDELRDIAAGFEADVQAQRVLGTSRKE